MTALFGGWLTMATVAEHQGSRRWPRPGSATPRRQHGGQGNAFRRAVLALYNVTSTQTSTGSVDSAADSYTPIGGFAMLTGMMLGEVSPGGVGTGCIRFCCSP
jgi:K+-transporting ATPase ATPase A chain